MRTVQEVVVALIRAGLMVAGVLYAVDVLVNCLSLKEHNRPEFDASRRFRSAWLLSVWAGVTAAKLVVRMSRPLVNILSEASADVGEWAITHRHAHVTTRH
ncbi:MAG TPA: hypothetical protein VGZ29_14400 [Terriglobia bacterium]|nr:hypothetical protein [Terriglobia bacterium]